MSGAWGTKEEEREKWQIYRCSEKWKNVSNEWRWLQGEETAREEHREEMWVRPYLLGRTINVPGSIWVFILSSGVLLNWNLPDGDLSWRKATYPWTPVQGYFALGEKGQSGEILWEKEGNLGSGLQGILLLSSLYTAHTLQQNLCLCICTMLSTFQELHSNKREIQCKKEQWGFCSQETQYNPTER